MCTFQGRSLQISRPSPDDREWQDDLSVVGLLVGAPEEVGVAPHEVGNLAEVVELLEARG